MSKRWWNRAVVSLAVTCGLLVPSVPANADDGDLRIEAKNFRCYDGTTDSYFGTFVKYSAPSPTTLYAGYSIVARERGSDAQVPVVYGTFDQMIPSLFLYHNQKSGSYRSMRSSLAGTDQLNAQTAESRSDENCKRLGDDEDDVQVKLYVICARTGADYRAYAVADIANHEQTATMATGSLKLLGRKSSGDFQELKNESFNQYLSGYSVYFQAADDTENGLRRVRAEIEFDVTGLSETISEREEADCD